MIKAIVFDCFGVLTTDGWLPFKAKYFAQDPQLLQLATDLNKQADSGLIDYADFMRSVAGLAGVPPAEASRQIMGTHVANQLLFDYIANLKSGYRIGILSNAAGNWLSEMFSPRQLGLFDAVALSCETGFIKPQSGAYETIAERLGVSVTECVLIDDQARYCSGAREIGMPAVVYRDTGQLKTDLGKLLVYSA